jgi:hypothetical protein
MQIHLQASDLRLLLLIALAEHSSVTLVRPEPFQ